MEDLAPAHHFVLILIEDLRGGLHVRSSLQRYLSAHHHDFSRILLNWRTHLEKGTLESFHEQLRESKATIYQETLFTLLLAHTQGASILEPLESLEQEMRQESRQQMEAHLGKLPFQLLVPLLLFQFPAFLILILGPLLSQMLKEVQ